MHSTEPDLIDARAMVDQYIRFGEGENSIPEFSRPVIIAMVSELLARARKENYEDFSSIADICAEQGSESLRLARIAMICRDRLCELSGKMMPASPSENTVGRFPARHTVGRGAP
jgi:hypothetical protein